MAIDFNHRTTAGSGEGQSKQIQFNSDRPHEFASDSYLLAGHKDLEGKLFSNYNNKDIRANLQPKLKEMRDEMTRRGLRPGDRPQTLKPTIKMPWSAKK
jgi:hypothetical protein